MNSNDNPREFDQNGEDLHDNLKMDQNSEASKEAHQSEPEDQEKADAPEEASAQAEAEEPARADAEISKGEPTSQQYSCSYTPPYYIPNFTQPTQTPPVDLEKKKTGIPFWVPILIAACLLISLVIGGLSGYFFSRYRMVRNPSGSSSTVTIIKNDGSIKVNEQIGSTGYTDLTTSEVVNLVADSVVEISTSQVQTDFFYQSYIKSGAGSGVIIGSNETLGISYVITNHHVIEDSDSVVVRLTTGKEFEATLVGSDADSDVAVLTIPVIGLTQAVLGKSSELLVGEEVVAIGNPLGELGGTVTNGIISALDRRVVIDGHRMTLLQTNAAINPGNSGGGLFNMAGELVGIVNAKQSDTGIEGLGFAIPIDVAYDVAKDLIDYGYVVDRLVLGFEVVAKKTSFTVNNVYTFNPGIYVSSSQHKNLAQYDRIVSINGREITQLSDYYEEIDRLQDGDTLKMVVSRLRTVGFYQSFENVEVEIPIRFTQKP